ncbi:lipid A-modifier LpxR family protein [Phenylobacterium sp.]|uniref:lipid A-modifier LpxR family protein n=1 Tax=Phenylobacterium sp. TaxID=1871053 RepID=UPI002CFC9520|nr:lipid A-modifier LpxR family protein [Phenylobacterium sp.]HLZ76554.1 lipid A-modifier LpxR family protein [Phenylobacterium sp.]
MRPLAILATVLTCAAATAASAQPLTLTLPASSDILTSAAHADEATALAILNGAAFAPKTASDGVDPVGQLLDRETYQPGAGLMRWMTGETQLTPAGAGGPVDSLRVSVGGALRTPGGLPLNLSHAQYDPDAYDVTITRAWPAAFALRTGPFGVDLTPHAGLGMTSYGTSAEAGATLRVMRSDAAMAEQLRAMGVQDGGAFGDRGRWYLFAAASGRAVGMNMLHGDQGWNRAGWSTDQTSTLTGDAQVGVGWRKGDMQTSFGYIHREVKGQNMLFGVDPKADSVVAFSLSIRPH